MFELRRRRSDFGAGARFGVTLVGQTSPLCQRWQLLRQDGTSRIALD
jgi:hypothetical protein